jgi:serine/threonine protein kinase/tetratricopeptide (TPR) repeat protein
MSSPGSEHDPLAALADDFLQRHRRGERPAPSEYAARHPELAGQIRELFPALLMMEDVRPQPRTAADGGPGAGGPPLRLGEYRIVREIGRGGMGVVYEAFQESLGRRVALKVLPPGALGDARQVQRFQREARAAARLHHSNIVPVFAVGEQQGTHFYVMQYIEGRPLNDVLAELRRLRDQADRPPSPAAVDPPAAEAPPSAGDPCSVRVARALLQGLAPPASQADGRAADPGEPAPPDQAASPPSSAPPSSSNPLSDPQRPFAKSVAQFGVQVAEALEYAAGQGVLHRDVKPSNLLLDVFGTAWLTDFGLAKATGTPDLTRPGHLLGTLRYLAPERFAGRADVRSDVYALGLTLYEMLALRPAFDAADQAELVRQVSAGEAPRLDRLEPQLPRDLVTIVHKAMAREPAERYQSAAALAEDLRRFLDDRSILARRAGLAEQAWRWCRRNPMMTSLLGALVVLAGLAAGFWWSYDRQKTERRGRARQAVESGLEQAMDLLRQRRRPEAATFLEQAQARVDEADSEALRRRLAQAWADLDLVARLEGIWLERPRLLGGGLPDRAVGDKYAAVFTDAGLDLAGDEKAVAARIHASAVRAPMVVALEDWAGTTADKEWQARLLRVARRADPGSTWRDRLRDPAVWKDRGALERLAAEAPVAELPPQTVNFLGQLLARYLVDSEPLLRKAQRAHPGDFWANYNLGFRLWAKLKPQEAVGFLRVAVAMRPESAVYTRLGEALRAAGHHEEAVAAQRRALELEDKDGETHCLLAMALQGAGKPKEALAALRRAVERAPDNGWVRLHLGKALWDAGDAEEAIRAYRKAAELSPGFYMTHYNLGVTLLALGQTDEAVKALRKGAAGRPPLAEPHYRLGVALQARGDWDEAIAAYREAGKLSSRLTAAHEALAAALLQRGRFGEARAAWMRCLASPRADTSRRAAQQLALCARLLAQEARLRAILRGEARPANSAEQRDLARLCQDYKREYAAAARFYAGAFAAQPDLAANLASQDRYRAARAAAQAGCGGGADSPKLEAERARLRRQALAWLNADADAWALRLAGGRAAERIRVGEVLQRWRREADLAGVRDPKSLAKLPKGEAGPWRKLWARVEGLLAQTPAGPLGQARGHMARREWRQASDCYARALELGAADDGHFGFEYAALLLLSGDRNGYLRACARMVERCGKTPNLRAYHVARACTLAPDVALVARAGRLAQKELQANAGKFSALTERGALHSRAGRFKEAVPLFERSLRADARPGRAVLNWLWLALAQGRLGQPEEARRWLSKAVRWLDAHGGGLPAGPDDALGRHLHNGLEAQVLRREAEALLKAGKK